MMMKISPPVILASESPRRKFLLEEAHIEFTVHPSGLEELPPMDELPNTYAVRNAYEKAVKVAEHYPDHIVIGADTVVAVDGKILGKPKNAQEANLMLSILSGKWHEVWTGFSVVFIDRNIEKNKAVKSEVCFRDLSIDEIDEYIETGEPMDKAGAYAIQGIGKKFVKEIKGSYHNIVGLPVIELCKVLDKLGVRTIAL